MPEHRAKTDIGIDADRRASSSGSGVVRWLQRQSRVARSEWRSHDRDLQNVVQVRRRSDGCRCVPHDHNKGCLTGIGQVGARLELDLRICAIVTGLQARLFGAILIIDIVVNSYCMAPNDVRVRRLCGMGRCDVRVFSWCVEQARVRHPRSQSEQPHQQRHERGVAFGALMREGLHIRCESLPIYPMQARVRSLDLRQTSAEKDEDVLIRACIPLLGTQQGSFRCPSSQVARSAALASVRWRTQ